MRRINPCWHHTYKVFHYRRLLCAREVRGSVCVCIISDLHPNLRRRPSAAPVIKTNATVHFKCWFISPLTTSHPCSLQICHNTQKCNPSERPPQRRPFNYGGSRLAARTEGSRCRSARRGPFRYPPTEPIASSRASWTGARTGTKHLGVKKH